MFKKIYNLDPSTKFLIHLLSLFGFIFFYTHRFLNMKTHDKSDPTANFDPFLKYGYWTYLLCFIRSLVLLSFPQVLSSFLGLVFYNPFKNQPLLKEATQNASFFICFRVVTRGDYPKLIDCNVKRNFKTCLDVGLENFSFEIVTDRPLNLAFNQNKVREIVIPECYETKTCAKFKARALQYCLEDHINQLKKDSDWIVHLDEETLLTKRSVRGILNFVSKNKHEIGQGVITYANEEINNLWTTLADCLRVGDDFGKYRLQFLLFHRPLFGFKGSYVVTKYKVEKDITFDHGPEGSIAEDAYFAMIGFKKGYTFDFIEGEMWEKSPFTILDFIKQRRRWFQGIFLVVHSKAIPLKNKFLLGMSFYGWATMPLTALNILWFYYFPLPPMYLLPINLMLSFSAGVSSYMFFLGFVKSFNLKKIGIFKYVFFLACMNIAMPLNFVLENVAVCWSLFSNKHTFYIVKKA